jgi:hypothetical protein
VYLLKIQTGKSFPLNEWRRNFHKEMLQPKPTLRAATYVARIILIAVLPAGTHGAQPAGQWDSTLAESGRPNWPAQRIWLPDHSDGEMLLAREAMDERVGLPSLTL